MLQVAITGKVPSGVGKSFIARLADLAYRRAGGRKAAEASIVIVGDAKMRTLNRERRGKDKVTDVLSFSYVPTPRTPHPALPASVGDIVICVPQVRRQAKRIGRAFRDEFALIAVHGILHLMGFDHETERQEREMFALQHDILIRAGVL